MTDGAGMSAAPTGIEQLVAVRRPWAREPVVWFALGPADRPLVELDRRVAAGDPLLERSRDPRPVEVRLAEGVAAPPPGTLFRRDEQLASGGGDLHLSSSGRVLWQAPGRRLHVALARHVEPIASPVEGIVHALEPGGIGIRADGVGLTGVGAAGEGVRGRLSIAVPRRDAELRAQAVDVGASGAILVVGARLDSEALTRARAIGARGIVAGSLAGRDLRAFLASEARQQAGPHPGVPFGVLILDGYGKRPIPGPVWSWLVAAEGREVALVQDPPALITDAEPPPRQPAARVRVAAGPDVGRDGVLVELVGPWRGRGGVYQPAGRVELDAEPPDIAAASRIVALADLERFE